MPRLPDDVRTQLLSDVVPITPERMNGEWFLVSEYSESLGKVQSFYFRYCMKYKYLNPICPDFSTLTKRKNT